MQSGLIADSKVLMTDRCLRPWSAYANYLHGYILYLFCEYLVCDSLQSKWWIYASVCTVYIMHLMSSGVCVFVMLFVSLCLHVSMSLYVSACVFVC